MPSSLHTVAIIIMAVLWPPTTNVTVACKRTQRIVSTQSTQGQHSLSCISALCPPAPEKNMIMFNCQTATFTKFPIPGFGADNWCGMGLVSWYGSSWYHAILLSQFYLLSQCLFCIFLFACHLKKSTSKPWNETLFKLLLLVCKTWPGGGHVLQKKL